jgi:hypothetical protein
MRFGVRRYQVGPQFVLCYRRVSYDSWLYTSTPHNGSLVKYVKDAKICTCRSVEAVIALDLLLQKLNATLRMDCVGIVSLC